MGTDHYFVLGILPDAEDVVVRAAYKALAQRYHPDRWQGAPEEAHRRMSEINLAYSVLGDKARRSEYDRARSDSQQSSYAPDSTSDQDAAFDSAMTEVEERWLIACSIYGDLKVLRSRLSRISTSLAFAFVTICLETKTFAQRAELASHLERVFLERYFGTDPTILVYARELIVGGHKDAARLLNRLVDVMGSNVESQLIIDRVDEEFGFRALREKARQDEQRRLAAKTLVNAVRTNGYYDDAERLAVVLGYKVSETGGGFFKTGEITVIDPAGKESRFKNSTAFIYWVQNTLSRDL